MKKNWTSKTIRIRKDTYEELERRVPQGQFMTPDQMIRKLLGMKDKGVRGG